MKLFGFELRKVENDLTTIQMIEMWCVEWISLRKDALGIGIPRVNVLAFPTQEGAETYAKALREARRLLGEKDFGVTVYRQKPTTDV